MQLLRNIGFDDATYDCTIRRKIFEILYSKIFFEGIYKNNKCAYMVNLKYYRQYLLYMYFHVVNTFLDNEFFRHFLGPFDVSGKTGCDIYDVSYEGILIACMGLSKRAKMNIINEDTIDYYTASFGELNYKDRVLNMVNNMMDKGYNGNYLE